MQIAKSLSDVFKFNISKEIYVFSVKSFSKNTEFLRLGSICDAVAEKMQVGQSIELKGIKLKCTLVGGKKFLMDDNNCLITAAYPNTVISIWLNDSECIIHKTADASSFKRLKKVVNLLTNLLEDGMYGYQ